MRVARVIPCLDVTAGRVVKGTNFVDLRDAGDPVELAARYDVEGADELVFLDITASSDNRDTTVDMVRRVADAGLHPVHRRRRHPHARGCPAHAARRRRQGQRQHRGGRASGVDRRDRRRVRRAVRRVRDRRQAPRRRTIRLPGWEVYLHGGRTPTGIDAVEWAREAVAPRRRRDPADLDGPRRHPGGLRPRADPGDRRRRDRAGDRQWRCRERSTTSSTASRSADADAVLAASIFHFREHTVAEAKAADGRRRHHRPPRLMTSGVRPAVSPRAVASTSRRFWPMSSAHVTTERRDGVMIVHLDDGKANALSFEVIAAVRAAIDDAEADDSVGALVIHGRPGRFSAGFDLGVMFGDDMSAIIRLGRRRWRTGPSPVRLVDPGRRRVHGSRPRRGALVLLGCDVRVGADVDAKVGLNEVAIKMVLPDWAFTIAERPTQQASRAARARQRPHHHAPRRGRRRLHRRGGPRRRRPRTGRRRRGGTRVDAGPVRRTSARSARCVARCST